MTLQPPPYELLGPDWDLEGSPETSYVILSTPRSGSTLLGEALAGTGVMGVPAEYLEFDLAVPYLSHRWQTSGMLEYRDRLLRTRSSSNGVFGAKVHWHQLVRVLTGLTDEPTTGAAISLLDRIFPGARLIRIRRNDTTLQAISHWRALKTGQFASTQVARRGEPDYDFDELRGTHAFILTSESGWDAFLEGHPGDALEFEYEQVAGDLGGAARSCARHLGLDTGDIDVPAPRLSVQRNDWTQEIRARYERDLAGLTG